MLIDKNLCTGCETCVHSCPTNCLEMLPDEEGFLFPQLVRPEDCIECGKCVNICPLNNKMQKGSTTINSYAGNLMNQQEIYNSTSGGAFFALANKIIDNNGVVFGAAYDKDLKVKHMPATTIVELNKLRKSKYVQSEIGNSYIKAKQYLDIGRLVLFSGTPCQIAGLESFLNKEYENLLKVEVFCSHVFSPLIWEKYLKYIEVLYCRKVNNFDFRYKSNAVIANWKNPCVKIDFQDSSKIIKWQDDLLINAFSAHLLPRKSCLNCKYKLLSSHNRADISIGDFWGCENTAPKCFNEFGVSAIITHTSKGEMWITQIKKMFKFVQIPIENIISGNPDACYPIVEHINRDKFYKDIFIKNIDFERAIRENMGFLSAYENISLKFGVWGSFNIRAALMILCNASNSKMLYQYSNSNIISLMSNCQLIPVNISLPTNPFRAEMLKSDFSKDFIKNINTTKKVDYLVIDFIEERFSTIKFNNNFITYSDALQDCGYKPENIIDEYSNQEFELWKNASIKFIEILKNNFDNKKIILVEAYLNDMFLDRNGNKFYFDNTDKIKNINFKLYRCYQYFKENFAGINIITIKNKNLLYTDKLHKHGCYPWHMNKQYYDALANELFKIICKQRKL